MCYFNELSTGWQKLLGERQFIIQFKNLVQCKKCGTVSYNETLNHTLELYIEVGIKRIPLPPSPIKPFCLSSKIGRKKDPFTRFGDR